MAWLASFEMEGSLLPRTKPELSASTTPTGSREDRFQIRVLWRIEKSTPTVNDVSIRARGAFRRIELVWSKHSTTI